MSLPESVRVKLSSEAAGAISITPVVVREMPMRELLEQVLGITGKQVDRIRELLLRGSLVSGSSRFRWQGWEADPLHIQELLDSFPDPDPSRPFGMEACGRILLRGAFTLIEIPREAGMKRRLLRRTSFWDVLAGVALAGVPAYVDYSYRDRADLYRLALTRESAAQIRAAANHLAYSALKQQVQAAGVDALDLYVQRG